MATEFTIFAPSIPTDAKYAINGPDCQILTISLSPGQKVEAEPGSMMFMHPHVKSSMECGSCSRMCTGETCCKVIYTNSGNNTAYIGLTTSYPAKLIPVDLKTVGNNIVVRGGSYVSAIDDVNVNADCDCWTCASSFGALGVVRQGITGSGTVFLAGGGTVMTRTLKAGEELVANSGSIVGFEKTVSPGLRLTGGCSALCFGGEGCCYTTLTGPGLVIVESMPFSKFLAAVAPPQQKNDGGGADVSTS